MLPRRRPLAREGCAKEKKREASVSSKKRAGCKEGVRSLHTTQHTGSRAGCEQRTYTGGELVSLECPRADAHLTGKAEQGKKGTWKDRECVRVTHTRWCGEQASSLALSGAPVCGSPKLPEGSRRDTGGGLRDVLEMKRGGLEGACAHAHLPGKANKGKQRVNPASFLIRTPFSSMFLFSTSG